MFESKWVLICLLVNLKCNSITLCMERECNKSCLFLTERNVSQWKMNQDTLVFWRSTKEEPDIFIALQFTHIKRLNDRFLPVCKGALLKNMNADIKNTSTYWFKANLSKPWSIFKMCSLCLHRELIFQKSSLFSWTGIKVHTSSLLHSIRPKDQLLTWGRLPWIWWAHQSSWDWI